MGQSIHLTFAGMEIVAQRSGNAQAIKNREAVLVLLKQLQAEQRASVQVQAPAASAMPVVNQQAPVGV